MIDIRALEKKAENQNHFLDEYQRALTARGASIDTLEKVLQLNKERKEFITRAEQAKASQNKASAQIPTLKKEGKDVSSVMAEMSKLSHEVKSLEAQAAQVDEQVHQVALTLPNRLHSTVPVGNSEEQNRKEKEVGTKRSFNFKPKEHWEVGEKLGFFDFERATKVTGSSFVFLKGHGARLERALFQYFMDKHSNEHGYTELIPPYMVNSASYVGTGQFPKFMEDVFHIAGMDYHLISTAEVPVTNYFREEILEEAEIPLRFCAFSPCFRSEAGAAGRDTRGITRQHQFHKVELLMFAHPNQSYELHEELTGHAEKCLEELELPYRRMTLCSKDTSFASAKTYDLEVWLPSSQTYREISSCSNFEDFQARRANIRFRPKGGKPQFVHTLNGSGLAVGRTSIAILENYQNEDGSVTVPGVLKKYMGGLEILR